MFSEKNKDFLESLPLNVRVQTLMQVQKKRKRKRKRTKLEKQIKVKTKKNKRNIKFIQYLPPRQRCQKLDTIKELMSYPKCRSVEVINNSARPGSNHREVNYINYK
jgi:hypothetical protein